MRMSIVRTIALCAAVGSVLSATVLPAPISPAIAQSLGSGNTNTKQPPQPFTAEFKTTSEQTLANGTKIVREDTELEAVDADGRRLNVTSTQSTPEMPAHTFYHVYDPVARTNTSWNAANKTASVIKLPPAIQAGQRQPTCWSTSAPGTSVTSTSLTATTSTESSEAASIALGSPRSVAGGSTLRQTGATPSIHEDLGTQTIQGVAAKGTRITRTIPVGAIGNDAPLVTMTETWRAESLGNVVRSINEDPRTGRHTKELAELSQGAPDPASFLPPSDYEIVTQDMHQIPCQR